MNKKGQARTYPKDHSLDVNIITKKDLSREKLKKVIERGSPESASVCSVLSPIRVGVLTTDDHAGTGDPFLDIQEERRCIQEVEACEIIPEGIEKKRGEVGDKKPENENKGKKDENLSPRNQNQGAKAPINLTIDTKSSLFEKEYDYQELLEEISNREYILNLAPADLFHKYQDTIKSFHEKIGVFFSYEWVRFKNKNTEEIKTWMVREKKDRHRNIFDAVEYYQRVKKKFKRFERVKGDLYIEYTFTVPDDIAKNWDHNIMIKIRRKLVKMLKKYGLYQIVVRFHFWGDKDPLKINLHFHILGKTNRRWVPEDEIKRKWAKIIGYNGVPVVDLRYTYNVYEAQHFYDYMVRPYILDVFIYWFRGGSFDRWQLEDILDVWEGSRMKNLEFYGYLRQKDIEEESEWEKLGSSYLVGYKKINKNVYAIFYYYEKTFDLGDWGYVGRKKYYLERVGEITHWWDNFDEGYLDRMVKYYEKVKKK